MFHVSQGPGWKSNQVREQCGALTFPKYEYGEGSCGAVAPHPVPHPSPAGKMSCHKNNFRAQGKSPKVRFREGAQIINKSGQIGQKVKNRFHHLALSFY